MNTANATNSSSKSANFTNLALRDIWFSFAWSPSNEGLDGHIGTGTARSNLTG
jgi:hypothetical protein